MVRVTWTDPRLGKTRPRGRTTSFTTTVGVARGVTIVGVTRVGVTIADGATPAAGLKTVATGTANGSAMTTGAGSKAVWAAVCVSQARAWLAVAASRVTARLRVRFMAGPFV